LAGKQTLRTLYAITKAFTFSAATSGFYALWLLGFPGACLSAKTKRAWRNFIFRHWAQTIVRVLGIKITTNPILPVPPFLLVSNHLSYLDVVIFATQLDCVFVAKREVASWPIFGLLCRNMNTIFIDRTSPSDIPRVNALIEETLRSGQTIVLFPEGTSTCGATVAPFKSSLLEPAAKGGYPVAYASISYRTLPAEAPAQQAVCWWGEMKFLPHLFGLFRLSKIEATLLFGAETIQARERKLLAQKLYAAINTIFIPSTVAEAECKTQNQTLILPLKS
jgi:1-acyl-sn-glycerol-3-phosphate acyltransferase